MNALQNTQEWRNQRKGIITGSRIGAILGHSPFSKRKDVMREMIREWFKYPIEFVDNVATLWGKKFESTAISDYQDETGQNVVQCGLHSKEMTINLNEGLSKNNVIKPHIIKIMMGASPDGLIGNDGVLEVKCPYSRKIKQISETQHYYDQIQLQLHVTDRKFCHFYTWTPAQHYLQTIEIDSFWLRSNIKELDDFMREFTEYVEKGEIYCLDNTDFLKNKWVDKTEDRDWTQLELHYDKLISKKKRMENEINAIKDKFIRMSEGEACKGNKFSLLHYQKKGRVNYTDLIKNEIPNVDIGLYQGKMSTVWVLKEIEKNKQEKAQ